ncbi:MAG: phosphotransferase [Candidatus Cloacimonetes bacterium]|nr:phosphotransferase [Candidatus Cloacimonadota bacterium]
MDNRIREFYNDGVRDEAAACFGVSSAELTELDGFENFIYEFSQGGQGSILRITHTSRRTKEMIDAEMHWIEYLHEKGVNCSLPLKSKQGNLVESVGSAESGFVACGFEKVTGQRLTKILDTKQFRYNYGRQIGMMHRLTKDYQPCATQRIQWYEDDLVSGFDAVVPTDHILVMHKMQQNTQQILAMKPGKDNYGLVHFDVHPGNFFVHNEDIYMFDFDDSQYAYFAADIAIVLFYFAGGCPKNRSREEFIREFYQDFMQGYSSQNLLSAEELAKIPIFLKQRELVLYAAVLQAYRGAEYDDWANWYMTGRKEKLEQDVPFLDMSF